MSRTSAQRLPEVRHLYSLSLASGVLSTKGREVTTAEAAPGLFELWVAGEGVGTAQKNV